jgi:hypothetical protein
MNKKYSGTVFGKEQLTVDQLFEAYKKVKKMSNFYKYTDIVSIDEWNRRFPNNKIPKDAFRNLGEIFKKKDQKD